MAVSAAAVALMIVGVSHAQASDARSSASRSDSAAIVKLVPESVTTRPDPLRAKEVRAQGCWVTEASFRAVTVLGFTFYRFHHRADWCQDGSRVNGVHFRTHWFSEVSSQAFPRSIESDFVTPAPSWEVTSFKKHLVENCVFDAGCISSTHPWVKLILRGDATWSYEAGQN
ncbi:hypothetical protein AB0N89_25295 [Amycolatopsis sp. NPDC089917]|uniref:hypothetical protein n=1 Tax=Amycolatopsis sp. NPDC089917 TaxID=3155187 RepID=UPI00343AFD51